MEKITFRFLDDEIKKKNHKVSTTINIYNSLDNWKNEIHDTQYLKSKQSVEEFYNREYVTQVMSHALESLKNIGNFISFKIDYSTNLSFLIYKFH